MEICNQIGNDSFRFSENTMTKFQISLKVMRNIVTCNEFKYFGKFVK
jgi:hypothetical protein